MKAVIWLHLLLFAALLLSFAPVFSSSAQAQTIRALLVGNDSEVPQHAKNMELIVGLLKEVGTKEVCALDSERIDYTLPNVRPIEHIKAWLENVRPTGNDIIFVYYSRTAGDSDAIFDREELVNKLGKISGRLKILITDTAFEIVENVESTDGVNASDVSKAVLENLFVEHKGFVHLTNHSEGELAFGDTNGGWFTQAFVDAIYATPANENAVVTWEDVLKSTQERTKKLYEENSDKFSDDLKAAMDASSIKESQTPMASGEFPILTATIHALLVIEDTADAGEKSVALMNQTRIRGLLKGAQSYGICTVDLASLHSSENSVTPDQIAEWAKAVNPRKNDTVFIFYSANDGPEADADRQAEILKRLQNAIANENAKKSRLQMLIVDTYRLGPAIPVARFGLPYPQTTFHNLFLEHEGLLHLVSKSEDELSFGDGPEGGWFTRALIESIYEIREREDFPPQVPDNGQHRKFLEWEELVDKTAEKIKKELFDNRYPDGFKETENYPMNFSEEQRNQLMEELETAKKSQTPKAHKLPKPGRM